MTARARSSLRSRLTLHLIVFQALAICIVAAAGAYALILHFGTEGEIVRPQNAQIVIDAVRRRPDGALAVETTPALARLRAESPDLWFVVSDEKGGRVTEGQVPEPFAAIAAEIDNFGSGNLPSIDGRRSVALRLANSDAGRVHVMTGGKTQSIWKAGFAIAARAVVPIVLTLALVAVTAIAWIIRREFRGVDGAAKAAASIDAGRRGSRLPETDMPAEILPLVRAVNNALGRLDQDHARQRRFLADAAHELKTPIAILTTRIETSVPGKDRDRRLLLDISRLANIAEQLLDTQRLDHSPDLFTRVDMVTLARSVAGDLAPLAIDAGYELEFDSALRSHVVKGDRAALERVVINLLQNAIAHGGGRGRITVSIDLDGAMTVADEGDGIAPEDRDRVFDPFFRAKPSGQGSGLGLSIVSDIVARHGGRTIIGEKGPGASFRVELPACEDQARHSPPGNTS